jgi:peptidoglycan/LPS O-acetylase OafA/YrhL
VEVLYLSTFRTMFGVGAGFVILVTLSKHPTGQAIARPLSSRALYPFSQLAYSAYLVNPMVVIASGKVLAPLVAHGEQPMPIYLPCTVVGTFGCAFLLHVLVERPGMELRPRSAI